MLELLEKFVFRLKALKHFQIFTILVRYLLGAAFVWASILKIKGVRFAPEPSENIPIESLAHFLEALYRFSFYWYFIGWGQLIAGFLMMSQAFSSVGAVVYFPIMLNIFIITLSFQSPEILTITSLMLLGNIYLLLWDWNRLKFIVLYKPSGYVDQTTQFSRHKIWTYIGILLCIVIIVFRIISTRHISL